MYVKIQTAQGRGGPGPQNPSPKPDRPEADEKRRERKGGGLGVGRRGRVGGLGLEGGGSAEDVIQVVGEGPHPFENRPGILSVEDNTQALVELAEKVVLGLAS